jgi:asparagine synthetase B (glutamine-hydrolysing)
MIYNLENYNYEIFKYSQVKFSVEITDLNKAIHLTRSTISSAIESHLIADVPVGVFLSGGLDSGVIASVASKYKETELNTLSIYFDEPEFSEKKYQDIFDTISKFEPRATVLDVKIREQVDQNNISVDVIFRLNNSEKPITVNTYITRVR